MKKCDAIRDLVLTDYIDGELDKNIQVIMESHLQNCRDCRAFAQAVKNNATGPFQKAHRQPVPVVIWETIRENIEAKGKKYNFLEGCYGRLKELVFIPKFVPVFASVVLMFLIGSVALNTIQIDQVKDKDQGEYLVSLLDTTGSLVQTDNNGFETSIERYFL